MRTLYRRFSMGPCEWRIFKADGSDPELKPLTAEQNPCSGSTRASECLIVIHDAQPSKELPATVIHELIHAAFETSGIGHTMRLNLKKEEQIAHAIAPYIAQALLTGGFWKTPRGEE